MVWHLCFIEYPCGMREYLSFDDKNYHQKEVTEKSQVKYQLRTNVRLASNPSSLALYLAISDCISEPINTGIDKLCMRIISISPLC